MWTKQSDETRKTIKSSRIENPAQYHSTYIQIQMQALKID